MNNEYIARSLLEMTDVCGCPGYIGLCPGTLRKAARIIRNLDADVGTLYDQKKLPEFGIKGYVLSIVGELLHGREPTEMVMEAIRKKDNNQYISGGAAHGASHLSKRIYG